MLNVERQALNAYDFKKILSVENLVELKEKNQATERFKWGFTYTFLFCILGGMGGGGPKSCYKTCVPQVKMQVMIKCISNK